MLVLRRRVPGGGFAAPQSTPRSRNLRGMRALTAPTRHRSSRRTTPSVAARLRGILQAARDHVFNRGWHERGHLGALLRRLDRHLPWSTPSTSSSKRKSSAGVKQCDCRSLLLTPSTPFAYSQVVSRCFALFRVVRFSVSAGHGDFCSLFDSRQLHRKRCRPRTWFLACFLYRQQSRSYRSHGECRLRSAVVDFSVVLRQVGGHRMPGRQ